MTEFKPKNPLYTPQPRTYVNICRRGLKRPLTPFEEKEDQKAIDDFINMIKNRKKK